MSQDESDNSREKGKDPPGVMAELTAGAAACQHSKRPEERLLERCGKSKAGRRLQNTSGNPC